MHTILEDGWTAFLLDSEFPKLTRHSDDWRISAVNRDFQVRLIFFIYPSVGIDHLTYGDD